MAGCYAPSCVSVSSLTLKTLDVQCQCECCDGISFELIINTPSLEYLNVRNYDLEDVVILRIMTSLIEADLDLIGELVRGHEEDIEEYYTAVQFLHCLCNVKCLKILIRRVEKVSFGFVFYDMYSAICFWRNYDMENVIILRDMTSLMEADLNLIGKLVRVLRYRGVLYWIIEADLNLIGELVRVAEEDMVEYYSFFIGLCNVKCLKIPIRRVEKLIKIAGLDSTVKFHNLTKLGIDSLFDFHELVKFLGATDNLQHLTFTLNGKHNTYREPKQVPSCILSCLKTVRINSSHDLNANDFKTIKYVLRNAQVLEMMEIPRSMEELEMLERGSESCQLVCY